MAFNYKKDKPDNGQTDQANYSPDQQNAYKRMQEGATKLPPAFEKLKDYFSGDKKKKDEKDKE